MSEAIHSGADTTLAPTNVSAPPPQICALGASAYDADPSVRAQGTDPEALPHRRSQARRLEAQGSVGPSLAELTEMLFTLRRLRTADYEGLKGLSSNFITVQ